MSALMFGFFRRNIIIRVFGCIALFALFSLATTLLVKTRAVTNASPTSPVDLGCNTTTGFTKTPYDFDGDCKADLAIWRPSNGTWYVFHSSAQGMAMPQPWGSPGDRIVPADYDGDGKTDYAVYTPTSGLWSILKSSNGQSFTYSWGAAGDIPTPGDFDGDGKADIAVWRPSNGYWYIVKSSDQNWYAVHHGATGDIPVVGYYDNDNKADPAVWRPSAGDWYWLASSTGGSFGGQHWGANGDIPVPADYDGDGKTDCAIWRPTTGEWVVLKSASSAVDYAVWGLNSSSDVLIPADYDGDRKANFATWRPSNGTWYILFENSSFWQLQLGVASDVPVPGGLLNQAGANPTVTPTPTPPAVPAANLTAKRLDPKNATGGTDYYSRNFSWGTSLFGLSGRAGLDAGLSLSYNSLVWTRTPTASGDVMVFNADKADVAPGFRFGFPVIEPLYTDQRTGKPTYLMVGSSGARTELRQTADPNVYESADSSYLQLKLVVGGTQEQQQFELRGTDGTTMRYIWKAGAYRCAEIKDRNGNYITVNHDGAGLLRTITDTLGRKISISYDNALNPLAITQTLANNTSFTWAAFSYATKQINYNFSGLTVSGPANNSYVKVLDRVTFTDGGYYRFDYNSYGQLSKINRYGAQNNLLNYVLPEYEAVNPANPDCPRLTTTKTWATNFNNGSETIVDNDYLENQPLEGIQEPVTLVKVTLPNGVIEKSYALQGGWAQGLPFHTVTCLSDACTGADKKRWTSTTWTQDNTALSYPLNPRVTSTSVSDSGSTKRTTISYHPQFGLVNEVREYESDTITVKRKSATDYNLSAAYISRRIIGLPSERRLYEGESALMTKVTFAYDEGDFSGIGQTVAPVRHDTANFGAGFVAGRGNLTSTTRHRTGADTATPASIIVSTTKYNTAGAVVSSTDAMNRATKVSYDDKFVTDQYANEASRSTFAYPTKVTTPGAAAGTEVFSDIKYKYDFGATMEANSPAPAGNAQGGTTRRKYDSLGRIERVTTVNTGAYTRYEYSAGYDVLKTYSTIINVNEQSNPNDDGVGAEDEARSETYFDGFGNTRATLAEHAGSAGGFTGQLIEYDAMGRVKRQSMPTEINASFGLAGDGTTRGWLWTSRDYDWKGRVKKTTNTDNTFSEAFYEGCGCAGGEVVTVEGESVPDESGNQYRRKQKIYSDILGREYKTEVLNQNGTVYSATVTKLNTRDQAVWVKQYKGAAPATALNDESCPTETCQITKMTYDGHGRLKTQKTPQQDSDGESVFTYYNDDKMQSSRDARRATTNYEYEHRGLLKKVTYGVPPNTDFLTPQLAKVERHNNGVTNLVLFGKNFSASAEISAKVWNSGTPTYSEIARYSGAQITRGTSGDQQTLTISVTDQSVLNKLNSNELYVNVEVPNTGRHSSIVSLYYNTYAPNVYYGAGILETVSNAPTVEMTYDDLGNRTLMKDGLGETNYQYDALSRMKSEIRKFVDTKANGDPVVMADAPLSGNRFELKYSYDLAGQLASVTDPFGAAINYGYDKVGRLKEVTGTSFGGVTTYAKDAKYQAWGAVKEITHGEPTNQNALKTVLTYNNRLQAKTYNLSNSARQVMSKDYSYYADGGLRYAQDLLDPKFDRLNIYDHAGRIKEGRTGLEARGGSVTQLDEQKINLPYRQSYRFNEFGNLTGRDNLHWGVSSWYNQQNNLNYTYKNNRVAGWQYDADGRVLQSAYPDESAQSVYNSAGQMVRTIGESIDATRYYDGNKREIKRKTLKYDDASSTWVEQPHKYYIRSSVLGNETVSEVWANGKKAKTFVRAAGAELAYQSAYYSETSPLSEAVLFEYTDASGMSSRTSDKDGYEVATGDGGDGSPVERDPMGGNVGTYSPYVEQLIVYEPEPNYQNILKPWGEDSPTYINGQQVTATLDGMSVSLGVAMNALRSGSADIDFARTDPWVLSNLGIVSVWNSNSGRTAPDLRPTEIEGDVIRIHQQADNGRWEYYVWGDSFWNVSLSNREQTTSGVDVIITPSPKTKPKGLPDCIKNYLVKRWNRAKNLVDSATYTQSNPISLNFIVTGSIFGYTGAAKAYTFNFSGTAAFTWGYNIDFLDKSFDESDGIDGDEVALAGHEFKHVEQYHNDANFTPKYLAKFFANLADAAFFKPLVDIFAGNVAHDSYTNIDFEKAGKKFQNDILADITKNGNPCDPNSVNGKNYGK